MHIEEIYHLTRVSSQLSAAMATSSLVYVCNVREKRSVKCSYEVLSSVKLPCRQVVMESSRADRH